MITYEDLVRKSKKRPAEGRDHEHELETAEFNIEGHQVAGKICKSCGERFFLMKDLAPLEEDIKARVSDSDPISIEDAFLLLAGTYPRMEISGRLVLQKEMFLLEKSFAPEHRLHLEPMEFVPLHMGPFSKKLMRVVEGLSGKGLVEVRPLAGREGYAYILTESGRALAEERKSLLPDKTREELRQLRRAWDELGSPGLLRIVYEGFSAYAGRSQIKEKVKEGPKWKSSDSE